MQVVPGQQGQAAAIILARLMYWFGHSRKVGGCRSQRRFPDDPPGVVWNKLEAKEIAAQTGLDCRAVDRAVDRLVAAGLIASVRGHVLRNVYARHLRPLEKAAELPPSDAAQEEETAGRDREEAATRELAAHLDASLPAILAHSALAGGSPDRPSVAGLSRMLGERIRWVSSPITPWLSSLVHDAPRVCNSVSSDRGAVMFHCLPRRSGVEPVNIVARRGRASAELIAAYRDTVIVVADGERRALLTSSRDWAATRSVELHETGPLPPPAAPSLRSCSADKQPRKDFRKGPRGASRFAGAQYAALVQLLRFGGMSPEGVADAVDFCRKHTNDEFAADQIDNEWWRDEQRWSLPVRLVPHDASRSSHPGLADVFGESHQLACLPPVVTLSEMECQRHDRPTIVYWRPGVPRWADERRARCPLFALREFDPVHDARPTFAFRIYLRIGSQRLV
ncbi:MAG TPA: MarR family winged helix-turn-helix transcriptional regulator, partial [Pirellulales bacterium]